MANFKVTRRIDAPPDVVFSLLSDLERAPERISGITRMEILTDGDIGVGTRLRETRVVMKREATEEMRITEFTPGESYAVECDSCGVHYRTDVRVRPDGPGSIVEMETASRSSKLMAKLMAPLISGMMRRCLAKDLDDVQRAAEAGRVGVGD